MTDPAVEAVQRAWPKGNGARKLVVNRPRTYMEDTAREMAKPIREVYMEILTGMPMNSMSLNMALNGILDVLGPLIFTTEELEELET